MGITSAYKDAYWRLRLGNSQQLQDTLSAAVRAMSATFPRARVDVGVFSYMPAAETAAWATYSRPGDVVGRMKFSAAALADLDALRTSASPDKQRQTLLQIFHEFCHATVVTTYDDARAQALRIGERDGGKAFCEALTECVAREFFDDFIANLPAHLRPRSNSATALRSDYDLLRLSLKPLLLKAAGLSHITYRQELLWLMEGGEEFALRTLAMQLDRNNSRSCQRRILAAVSKSERAYDELMARTKHNDRRIITLARRQGRQDMLYEAVLNSLLQRGEKRGRETVAEVLGA